MGNDGCVPVHVALQLMDHSSLGRGSDYQDFQRTSRHLQKALRSIVNGSSSGTLSGSGRLIRCRTSSRLQQLHRNISQDPVQHPSLAIACPLIEGFGTQRKVEPHGSETRVARPGRFISAVREYAPYLGPDVSRLLSILPSWSHKGVSEKLQAIPESLDAHITDKHFLTAVDLLQDALRTIRRSEIESISALSDLRVYFSNQETVRLRILSSVIY